MTNREKLMQELGALDDESFWFTALTRRSILPETLESYCCRDCREKFGSCKRDDDDECAYTMTEWLGATCTRDALIIPVLMAMTAEV